MNKLLSLGAVAALATFAACDSVTPDAVTMPEPGEVRSEAAASSGALRCPSMPAGSVTRAIGPQGGTVELHGHSIVIPKNAVRGQGTFTMEVPETGEMRVRITAEGHDGYDFARPATLTLSYAGCAGVNDRLRLEVVHLAEDGGIESYGGEVDWDAKTVTADIDHLSDYAIGTNRSDYAIGTN